MRVLLSKFKFRCPFICFCKPSSHIYTFGPLKLENTPHSHPISVPEVGVVEAAAAVDNKIAIHENHQSLSQNGGLKSSLRKSSQSDPANAQKKKVQWLDFLGKELADIKEFESSEAGDTEYEGVNSRGCVCSIL